MATPVSVSSPAPLVSAVDGFGGVVALLTMEPHDGSVIEATVAMAGEGWPWRAWLPLAMPARVECPWGVPPAQALALDHLARRQDALAHLAMMRRTAARLGQTLSCAAVEFPERALAKSIVARVRAAGLVVLGAPPERAMVAGPRWFDQVVSMSGRPVLVVPRCARIAGPPRRILIAWHDRPEACRALHDALPWLRAAAAVRIVIAVGYGASRAQRQAVAGTERLRAHLAHHGVSTEVACVDSQMRPPEDILLEEAYSMAADLIVAGASGRHRTLAFAFGGTTLSLIRRSRLPLLLAS
ncbi:nucleotide-binding universal stress UspA family protein [Luteibacter jiangsuensis]|uniref:Nucleotide-binding universal stress UspA family protein n=1 Tax=Luteibacter jiangsuensis TaxID=637577 RepID=A0ABT9SYK3_9GAMM|nr:universal stress protein [Luteibacter jiangsuensis]MDQ0010083.1 nucleotide-binding universal stress UspA family protein [Luteibacter jiangsuensis]